MYRSSAFRKITNPDTSDPEVSELEIAERKALVVFDGGPEAIGGDEAEIPGEIIPIDDDRAFSAFRDSNNDSASDYSDIEEMECF